MDDIGSLQYDLKFVIYLPFALLEPWDFVGAYFKYTQNYDRNKESGETMCN